MKGSVMFPFSVSMFMVVSLLISIIVNGYLIIDNSHKERMIDMLLNELVDVVLESEKLIGPGTVVDDEC